MNTKNKKLHNNVHCTSDAEQNLQSRAKNLSFQ